MTVTVRELTPRGAGGVSVLAVRGPGALARVARLAPGARLVSGRPVLARLRGGGEDLDEALVCVLGPDEVELHVHGSPPLARRLLRELGDPGAPEPAGASSAAVEEVARARLPFAPCEAAARLLLDQAEGALRRDVLAASALVGDARRAAFDALLERGRVARACLVPLEVVLAGPVNAGKSTLFNALVGEQRVVVSDEAGTTRDRVREPARLGAWPVFLSDTAGERALDPPPLRAGADPQLAVERAGQERARAARSTADLVLWLTPLDGPAPYDDPPAGATRLWTRADRVTAPPAIPAGEEPIAALTDPAGARAAVLAVFRRTFGLPADPWTPGAGVPFADGQLARLAELRDAGPGRIEDVRAWLDGVGRAADEETPGGR